MSSFVVSARKYRPLIFEDVVGQEHIVQTLKNAIRNDQLAHAFLFCGPRGVGKTSCARILAKTINCENRGEDMEACGTCSLCKSFSEQQTFNIIELDAASYNSVDHIRTLTDQVRFQPQQGKYKVFIIDEVHMLSQSAFNAFLKTLEEPPPYAIFILATTEKHKIIPTILSRCQTFDFKRIPVAQTIEHLKTICDREGYQVDEDAFHIIAQKGEGSLRDSLSIFDRIISFAGKEVTYKQAIENLNVLDYDYYFQIVDSFFAEDFKKVLILFDEILQNGFDPDIFLLGLGEHFRNLLVSKDHSTVGLMEVSEKLKTRYLQQSALSTLPLLLSGLQIVNECDIAYPMAKNKRLHVEMALLKINYVHKQSTINPLTNQEKKTFELDPSTNEVFDLPKAPAKEEIRKQAEPISAVQKPSSTDSVKIEPVKEKTKPPNIMTLDSIESVIRTKEKQIDQSVSLTLENVCKLWSEYTSKLESPSLKTVLENAEIGLEQHTLKAIIGTNFQKSVILQEPELMQFIRNQVNVQTLQLEVILDPERAPEEMKDKKRILTVKEKYDMMVQQNPVVKQLAEQFHLKVDHS